MNEKRNAKKQFKSKNGTFKNGTTSDNERSVPEPFQLLGNWEHVLAVLVRRTSA
jgi:hypothetical protein